MSLFWIHKFYEKLNRKCDSLLINFHIPSKHFSYHIPLDLFRYYQRVQTTPGVYKYVRILFFVALLDHFSFSNSNVPSMRTFSRLSRAQLGSGLMRPVKLVLRLFCKGTPDILPLFHLQHPLPLWRTGSCVSFIFGVILSNQTFPRFGARLLSKYHDGSDELRDELVLCGLCRPLGREYSLVAS